MAKASVQLQELDLPDWEDFIVANQVAFNYGALTEFGQRHAYFEEAG